MGPSYWSQAPLISLGSEMIKLDGTIPCEWLGFWVVNGCEFLWILKGGCWVAQCDIQRPWCSCFLFKSFPCAGKKAYLAFEGLRQRTRCVMYVCLSRSVMSLEWLETFKWLYLQYTGFGVSGPLMDADGCGDLPDVPRWRSRHTRSHLRDADSLLSNGAWWTYAALSPIDFKQTFIPTTNADCDLHHPLN